MKGEHVDVVAPPGDFLACGGDFQSHEVDDRARWRMFSRDPLRVHQRERTGVHGERQLRMKDMLRSLAQVDIETGGILRCLSENLGVRPRQREPPKGQ